MKRDRDFYEGKFSYQYEKTLNNILLRVWHYFALSSRHIRAFDKFVKFSEGRKGVVLDYGCGGGNLNYLRLGDVYGVDISNKSIGEARKIYKEAKCFDGYKIPYRDNFFDYVVCSQVFGHIVPEEKDKILREIRRVSKNGAKFLFNIETDSQGNRIIDLMKKDKKFYKKYWIDMYGHDGLEIPNDVIKRFDKNGFRVKIKLSGLKYIWEPSAYVEVWGNEVMKVINNILVLKIIYLFFGGILSKIFEDRMDIDKCTGISIMGKVKKI